MNNNFQHVEILLSTFNGERFLHEQLDSLLDQTHKNWDLLVRDDGSSDDTIRIIEEYSAENPGRIKFISDGKKRLGACASFASLLARSTAPYVMFCDQDDVWLPEKIEATLEQMLKGESENPGVPVLVHTDLLLASSDLGIITDSFWQYQNLEPGDKQLKTLLLLNNVTGCTLMANRALVDSALPLPPEAMIHDWWLALVAAGLGRIKHVGIPLIKYRQHGSNVLGAARYSPAYFIRRLGSLKLSIDLLQRIVEQATAFHSLYGDRLSPEDRDITRSFSTLLDRGILERLMELFRHKFRCHGFLRSLGVFTLLLLISKRPVGKEKLT